MPRPRWLATAATLSSAVASIAPQIAALLLLPSAEFGAFSLVYLIFAFGSSVSLSVVAEPPIRATLGGGDPHERPEDQLATALWLSLAFGFVAATVGVFLMPSVELAAVIGVATAAATFRVSARYQEVLASRWGTAMRADTAGLVVFCAVVGALVATGTAAMSAVVVPWALGSLVSAAGGLRPALLWPNVVGRWVRHHRAQIKDLLGESLILDIGAIGGPYLVAPILGLADFGIYRGISNIAAPVRLVLNPLRPKLATLSGQPHRARRVRRAIVTGAIGAAVSTWLVLYAIALSGANLGVLTDLSSYAIPAGLFVGLNLLGHFEYIVARPAVDRRQLVVARAVQSGTVFTLPVVGALAWGLGGAIWGLVVATVIGAAGWVIVGRHPQPPPTRQPG